MARVVRVYRSSDASAPVLTGQAGAFNSLMDAVLVDGYGATSAAGWTQAFSGTNKAIYRNDTTDGSGTYYRIEDDYTSTNQRYAGMWMAETASAVDTITNPYPTGGTGSRVMGVEKSATQDATARDWVIIADNCAAHIFIKHGSNGTEWEWTFIGDIFSFKSADAFRGVFASRGNGSSSIQGSLVFSNNTNLQNRQLTSTSSALGIVRGHAGTGTALNCNLHSDVAKVSSSGFSSASGAYFGSTSYNLLAYPNAVNNGLFLAPIWLSQANTVSPFIVRGYMPGLWAPMHNRPLGNNDTFSGASGHLSGKTFEAFNIFSSAQIFVETSNTWS